MPARHLVARQTIEIVTPDRATAEALAERTSRATPALIAAVERALDAVDVGDARVRFDRVVVDLGPCAAARWEDDLVGGMARALGPALDRTGPVRADDAASALALLAAFAATGRLPWWSAAGETPATAVATLAAQAADAAAVRGVLASPGATARLGRQLAPASLATLARLAWPALGAEVAALATTFTAGNAPPMAEAARTAAVWRAILDLAAAGDAAGAAADGEAFRKAVALRLARNAAEAGTGAATVRNAADIGERGGRLAHPPPDREPEPQHAATPGATVPSDSATDLGGEGGAAGRGDEATRRDGSPPADARPGTPAPLAAPGSTATSASMPDRPVAAATGVGPAGDPRGSDAAAPAALAVRLAALARGGGPRAAVLARLGSFAADLAPAVASDVLSLIGDAPPTPATLAAVIRRLAAAGAVSTAETGRHLAALAPAVDPDPHDGVAVGGAGVALLWPFVPALLRTTGLLADDADLALAARHRAAALLDHLVTGALVADEMRLALPKLLAGLDLDAVHDPGPPIDAAEAAACADLLAAVALQAPSLAHIPVDGIRALFLVRPGVLTTRDGHWLLRVERRDHDVLLDRLPWPTAWVRLAWMPLPLRVEW